MAAPATGVVSGAGWPSWPRFGIALVGALGVALRVFVYRSKLGIPESDEAVVGLMVRHILHGQIPTFYWGQAYGGSQEALLTAPLFLVFGSGWLALRIVPIALTAVAALIVWRVGRRLFGEPTGAVAGALLWIWPPFTVYRLTLQFGFYASDIVYAGLLILLALRIVERPDRVRVGLFGLVFGLAFWESSQIVPIAAAVIAWTIWRQPRCLRQLWVALPLAVLGALPWLVWNLRHDWGSLSFPITPPTSYTHRLRIFVSPIVPMLLGIRAPFSQQPLVGWHLTTLIYVALLALFVFGAVRARRRPASILYVIAFVFPFIYAIHPETLIEYDPRYIVILSPVLALLLAQVATSLPKGAVLLVLACLISAVTLHRMDTYAVPSADALQMAPRNLSPLIDTLDRLHVDRVYADYWLAYVLTFDTRERIVAVQNKFTRLTFSGGQAFPTPDPYNRYAPYQREVSAARHGFVFFHDGIGLNKLGPELVQHGYRRYLIKGFVIFAPPATG